MFAQSVGVNATLHFTFQTGCDALAMSGCQEFRRKYQRAERETLLPVSTVREAI
jgi:hypothetical protein